MIPLLFKYMYYISVKFQCQIRYYSIVFLSNLHLFSEHITLSMRSFTCNITLTHTIYSYRASFIRGLPSSGCEPRVILLTSVIIAISGPNHPLCNHSRNVIRHHTSEISCIQCNQGTMW